MRNVFLKTLIIERECFKRFKKLILDGPKYRVPLMEGIDNKSFSVFFKTDMINIYDATCTCAGWCPDRRQATTLLVEYVY